MKNRILIIVLLGATLMGCTKKAPFVWTNDYDISVMSFNLRFDTDEDGENKWNNRRDACVELLKKERPTIIGIQEGMQQQVDYLDGALSNYRYIGEPNEYGFYGEYKAIFYDTNRLDLLEDDTFWLSETPDTPSLGWDSNNVRIVTWAKFRDVESNKVIYVFNTHFDHKGKVARVESGKLLAKKIQEIVTGGEPVFVTGDFNTLIRNKAIEPLLTDGLLSARRFAKYTDHFKSFNAFGRWYLSRNIDFIFYRDAEALSFRTIKDDYGVPFISDHYPLITHFNY